MHATHAIRLAGVVIGPFLIAAGCSDLNGPPTGAIQVSLTTSGEELDPDGYQVVLENGTQFDIGLNASVPVADLPAGSTLVRLIGLEPNCRTVESNPRIVTVVPGKTVSVPFTVTCVLYTGSIRVLTESRGGLPDADGYTLQLSLMFGGTRYEPIGVNDSTVFTRIPEGNYIVTLQHVARNCAIGNTVRPILVTPGKTTSLTFSVECNAGGNLRLITSATGIDVDPSGYTARVTNATFDTTATLSAFDNLLIAGVAATEFTVDLNGVAPNCQTVGPRAVTVVVPIGGTVDVRFDVTCARSATRLAFVSSRDGNEEIFVVDLDEPVNARLTNHPARDFDPAWSPDGSRIAFASTRHGNAEIYVMNVDGSNVVRLTDHIGSDIGPVWSPDGKRIAFESSRGIHFDIYTMNADGSNVDRLTHNSTYDGEPSWAPNEKITFIATTESGHRQVHTMNAFGADVTRLTNSNVHENNPRWSPDGTRIAFARTVACPDGSCLSDIFVMNADGSSAQRLNTGLSNLFHNFDPSWSADGRRIAFTGESCYASYYYGIYCQSPVIYVYQLNGNLLSTPLVIAGWSATWR